MEREDLLRNIAPCGLVCYTCPACGHGIVKEHAGKLLHSLYGAGDFLKQSGHPDMDPFYAGLKMIAYYAGQSCPGCRGGANACTLENCVFRPCTLEKGVDFCAECDEFPCGKPDLPQVFMDIWRESGRRIREVGAARFFEEEKDVPHFLRYAAGSAIK